MDSLLGSRSSTDDVYGTVFTDGPSTQMMRCIYSPHTNYINNPRNSNTSSIIICGSCHQKVQDNEETVFCESDCKLLYHRTCVGLTEQALRMLNQEHNAEWVCDQCYLGKRVPSVKFLS